MNPSNRNQQLQLGSNNAASHQHHRMSSSLTFDFQPQEFSSQFGIENIENLKPESYDFVNLYRETNYQQQPAFVPMNAASLLAREDFALNSPTLTSSPSGFFSPFGDVGDTLATDFSASHLKFDGMKLGDASGVAAVSRSLGTLNKGNGNLIDSNGDLSHQSSSEYTCKECSRTFTKLVALRSHEVVHTNEKKHNCLYCAKAFARRHDMLRHERTVHATEKSLTCDSCKSTFPDLESLQFHCVQESHPFPDRQNPPPATKAVKTKSKIHKKTHSGHGLGPSQSTNMMRMMPTSSSFPTQGMPMQIPLGNISGVPLHNPADRQSHSTMSSTNNTIFGLQHQNQHQLFNGQQQGLKQQTHPLQQQHQQSSWSSQMMPNVMPANHNQQPIFMPMNFAAANSGHTQQQPSGFPAANAFLSQNQLEQQQNQQHHQFSSGIHQRHSSNQSTSFLPEFNTHPSSNATSGSHQRPKDQSSLPQQLDIQKQMQERAATQLSMHTPLFNSNKQNHMVHGDTMISPAFRRSSALLMDDPFESAVDGLVIQEPMGGAEAFLPLSVLSMDFEP